MKFSYVARNAQGEKLRGVMEAANSNHVAEELMREGRVPLQIVHLTESDNVLAGFARNWAEGRVSIDELIMFSRQMRALMRAGVPITRAIRGIGESTSNKVLQVVLNDLEEELESGMPLSRALHKHPKIFSGIYVNMIQVGENTGQLEEAFNSLSFYLEQERETRKRIKQAVRYPIFVIGAITVAMVIINLFVIPAFASVFEQFRAELPWPTRVLIGVSEFMVNYGGLLLVLLVMAGIGFYQYIHSERGELFWDRFKLRVPLVGRIINLIILSRFCSSFAMMLKAGVPLVQGLGVVSGALGNRYVGDAIRAMHLGIERGDSFTRTARSSGMFTPLVLQMMAVGEETGAMDVMLMDVAQFYEEEVDYDLKRLADNIEPILLVVIGVMVLVLALGVFLPMWELGRAATGA